MWLLELAAVVHEAVSLALRSFGTKNVQYFGRPSTPQVLLSQRLLSSPLYCLSSASPCGMKP